MQKYLIYLCYTDADTVQEPFVTNSLIIYFINIAPNNRLQFLTVYFIDLFCIVCIVHSPWNLPEKLWLYFNIGLQISDTELV